MVHFPLLLYVNFLESLEQMCDFLFSFRFIESMKDVYKDNGIPPPPTTTTATVARTATANSEANNKNQQQVPTQKSTPTNRSNSGEGSPRPQIHCYQKISLFFRMESNGRCVAK